MILILNILQNEIQNHPPEHKFRFIKQLKLIELCSSLCRKVANGKSSYCLELCYLILAIVLKDSNQWNDNDHSPEFIEHEWAQNLKQQGAIEYLEEAFEQTRNEEIQSLLSDIFIVAQTNI